LGPARRKEVARRGMMKDMAQRVSKMVSEYDLIRLEHQSKVSEWDCFFCSCSSEGGVVYFDDYYGAEEGGDTASAITRDFSGDEHSQGGQNYEIELGGSRLRAIRIYVSLI
jgi:hypothetical protein